MFTTGWAAPRRRSVCRTANVLALKSLLGRSQLLVAYAAVLSLSFTGTFISYLSSTLEAKRHCESRGSSDAALRGRDRDFRHGAAIFGRSHHRGRSLAQK